MNTNNFCKEDKDIKRRDRIVFGVYAALLAAILVWICYFQYLHSFSQEKWSAYPERRAIMTFDLFYDHELVGMTEAEVVDLLGENDNDRGRFVRENRFVYNLGYERSVIDDEWLLIDFRNGIVTNYSIKTD